MSLDTFQYIYDLVESKIDAFKCNNYHTNPIAAEERLVVTIR
jgi:hypothetical protein